MAKILVLNGPNLNLLGNREPKHYGTARLVDVERQLQDLAKQHGHDLAFFQSNAEHELIERIHKAGSEKEGFIIINPAAFTHTSIALRDALSAVAIPFIEVHISNIHAREDFRRTSYFSDMAVGVICGLGTEGYSLAFQAASTYLSQH